MNSAILYTKIETLLDTHTLLWFLNGDEQLSQKARKCIEDPHSTKTNKLIVLSKDENFSKYKIKLLW